MGVDWNEIATTVVTDSMRPKEHSSYSAKYMSKKAGADKAAAKQTANLRAEAGHDRLRHKAGVDADPIPELEFDQTLGC